MNAVELGLALLLVVAMGLCVLAFRSPRAVADDLLRHRAAQREFYRQRQTELQADFDMGLIDEQQQRELNAELDRQLLEENAELSPPPAQRRSVLLWASVAALPLLSLLVYDQLGYRLDLKLLAVQRQLFSGERPSEEGLQRFEALVEDILQRRPETTELLVTMAAIRRQQGDYRGAVDYYQRLSQLYPQDADALAQLAQARYLAAERRLDGETRELLQRALAINPDQATALGVLGINAFAVGDYLLALKHWQRLLGGLDARSGEAMVIASGVNEAKRRAIEEGKLRGLMVNVALDAALGDKPEGVLFVVARATDGNPMPVAALRQPVSKEGEIFPLRLFLTDGDVIRQGKRLEDFAALSLSAHISRSGTAVRRTGDWVSAPLRLSTAENEISLLIDSEFAVGGEAK